MQEIYTIVKALKTILERLNNNTPSEDTEVYCSHDCTSCKYHIREEGYDQEWGMFKFMYFKCTKGYDVAFHVKSNCCDYEQGENTLIYMSDKEKRKYEPLYMSPKQKN